MKRPRNGFVLGKFLPPHQGHVFMCEFARQYCENLTILVCSMPDEAIPGKLRFQWMKEMFPDCNVVWEQRVLPQEPKGEDDLEFWETWRNVVLQTGAASADNTQPFDVVFASEDYGHRLAAEVGARFVPVDISRTARAVSGTAIRANPFENWEYIPHVVRPYYVKRVVLFGPESTGKSTLAQALGEHYHTVVAPEYGRTYTETFGADNLTAEDLNRIVSGHLASVAAAKRQANKVLIEDTDPVLTGVWSDMLLGERVPWFAEYTDYGDLYLLTDVDIPWVNDGTRYFENDADRRRFFDICKNELDRRGVNYVRVSGTREQRIATAITAIDQLMKENTNDLA